MKQDLFRKESMDQLSRPDQLSDYIRVSTPAVWVLLAAIILLLAGTCVWGIFGRLDTTVQGAARSDGTALTAYFTEEDAAKLSEGMTVAVPFLLGVALAEQQPVREPVPRSRGLGKALGLDRGLRDRLHVVGHGRAQRPRGCPGGLK